MCTDDFPDKSSLNIVTAECGVQVNLLEISSLVPSVPAPTDINDTFPDQLNMETATPMADLEGFYSVPEDEFQRFLADMFGALAAPSQTLPFRSEAHKVLKQFCIRRGGVHRGLLDYFDIVLDDWRDPDNDQALTSDMEEIVSTATHAARDFLQSEFESFVANAENGQSDL